MAISRTAGAVVVILVVIVAGVASALILTQSNPTSSTTSSSPSRTVVSSSPPSTSATSTKLMILTFAYSGAAMGSITSTMYQAGLALDAWKKYGLNVTFVNFPGGEGQLISAIAAGQIQAGHVGILPFVSAASSGVKIKLFAMMMNDAAWTIAVPANSTLASLSQVKGTKFSVAITNIGTGTWSATLLIMNAAGLTQGTDYTLLPSGSPPAEFAALQQGKTQSVLLSIPALIGFSASSHFRVRYLANSSSFYPKPWIEYGFIATPQLIQQNPESLRAFVQGYTYTYNYFKSNPDWAINFLTKFYNVNQTQASVIYGITLDAFTGNTIVNPQALQNVESLALRSGIIQSNQTLPPTAELYQNVS